MKYSQKLSSGLLLALALIAAPAAWCFGSKKPSTPSSVEGSSVDTKLKKAPLQFKEWKLTDTFEPLPSLLIYKYMHEPSGLAVLLSPKLGINVVGFVVAYNVGSRFENKGRTGLAHLFEHMMFRGTDSFAEPFKKLSEWGDNFNAYTSFDITLYHEVTPKAVFPELVKFEAERMRKLKITKEGFDKERGAVVSERKMRTEDSPFGRLFWELHIESFLKHPYHTGPIGWQDDLDATKFEDALDFYKRFYAPNRAVVSIVGDFQVEEALNLLQENFGSFVKEKWVEPKVAQEPKHLKSKRVVVPLKAESVMIADAALGSRMNDPEVPADSLFCYLLADNKLGYLTAQLVETGAARSVSADCSPNVDPGLSTVFVVGNPNVKVAELEKAYDKALKGFSSWMNADLVEKAKMFYLAGQWSSLRDPINLAEQLAHSATVTGNPLYDFKFLEATQKVTLAEVQNRFKAWYRTPHTRVIIEPSEKSAPFVKR